MAANDPLVARPRELTAEEAERLAAQIKPSWEMDDDEPTHAPPGAFGRADDAQSKPFVASDTIIEGMPTVAISNDMSAVPPAPPPPPSEDQRLDDAKTIAKVASPDDAKTLVRSDDNDPTVARAPVPAQKTRLGVGSDAGPAPTNGPAAARPAPMTSTEIMPARPAQAQPAPIAAQPQAQPQPRAQSQQRQQERQQEPPPRSQRRSQGGPASARSSQDPESARRPSRAGASRSGADDDAIEIPTSKGTAFKIIGALVVLGGLGLVIKFVAFPSAPPPRPPPPVTATAEAPPPPPPIPDLPAATAQATATAAATDTAQPPATAPVAPPPTPKTAVAQTDTKKSQPPPSGPKPGGSTPKKPGGDGIIRQTPF